MAYKEEFKFRRSLALVLTLFGTVGFPAICMYDHEIIGLAPPFYIYIAAQILHYQHQVGESDKQ